MFQGANKVVMDHNSVNWNADEGIGAYRSSTAPLNNVTISWNIVAEGLDNHSTGILVSGNDVAFRAGMTDIDLHHNLTMNDSHRNPAVANQTMRHVNNITHNAWQHFVQIASEGNAIQHDFIGNIWKAGPQQANGFNPREIEAVGAQSIYLSQNKGFNQLDPDGNQWVMVYESPFTNAWGTSLTPAPTSWQRTTPLPKTTYPVIAEPVGGLEANMLPTVGASQRLACDGSWVSARDSVDTRLINQYQTNTGISTLVANESQVGGFPIIASGTPCADADHDGMPDVWETAHGLNPNLYADANQDRNGDGYTNLEEYISGTGVTPPPPPSSLPDVVVTALSYANGVFTSTVRNQGTVATPSGIFIGVGYSVDGVFRTWGGSSTPLAAGASVTIGTDGGPYTIPTGTHTIVAYVDDANRFAESNETNNTLSQSITVGLVPVGLGPPGSLRITP